MNRVKVGKTATITVAWKDDGKPLNTGKAETKFMSMNKAVLTVEAANKPHTADVHGVSAGLTTVEATIDLGKEEPSKMRVPFLVIGESAMPHGISGAATVVGGEPDPIPPSDVPAPHAGSKHK